MYSGQGSIMLVIHLFTAFCSHHLPETKGRDIGHSSLDNDCIVGDEMNKNVAEMSFCYDDGNVKTPRPRRIV